MPYQLCRVSVRKRGQFTTQVPADAFTAEILGTERAGNGVLIRDNGLVLTIGYLMVTPSTARPFTSAMRTVGRELVPNASKIAILVNPNNPTYRLILDEEIPRTARNLSVALPIVEATTPEELDAAFASAAAQHVDAIYVFGDALAFVQAPRVIALAACWSESRDEPRQRQDRLDRSVHVRRGG